MNSRSKYPRWTLKGCGVRISPAREQEQFPSRELGQLLRKFGDLSSYDASSPLSQDMFTQKQHYITMSLFIWEEPNQYSHLFVHGK